MLTQQFCFSRILPDDLPSSVEMGFGEGVTRDIYTTFWEEFYDCCTVELEQNSKSSIYQA